MTGHRSESPATGLRAVRMARPDGSTGTRASRTRSPRVRHPGAVDCARDVGAEVADRMYPVGEYRIGVDAERGAVGDDAAVMMRGVPGPLWGRSRTEEAVTAWIRGSRSGVMARQLARLVSTYGAGWSMQFE